MDKIFEWLKNRKNWKWVIIIACAIFFVPLIIIHLLFKIPCINGFFIPAWSAGEFLGYVGAFYAFLGTAIFSCLALWQNHILSEKTDEYNKLLEKMERLKNMPDIQAVFLSCNGNFMNLDFSIINLSENVAKRLQAINLKIINSNGNKIFEKERIHVPKLDLLGGERVSIELQNPPLHGVNITIEFLIRYEDKYNQWHESKIVCNVPDAAKDTLHTKTQKPIDITINS